MYICRLDTVFGNISDSFLISNVKDASYDYLLSYSSY